MKNYKERLDELSEMLIARGMVDIKLHIKDKRNTTEEKVAEDLIHLLESFLNGDMIDHEPIGDSIGMRG